MSFKNLTKFFYENFQTTKFLLIHDGKFLTQTQDWAGLWAIFTDAEMSPEEQEHQLATEVERISNANVRQFYNSLCQ
jgi:hypothetical protein